MTVQRQFTVAEYLGWTDNYARAIQAVLTATGDEDTPATAAAYAAAVRNAINAFTDPDTAQITIDMLPAASAAVLNMETPVFLQQALAGFNSAVIGHLGEDVNTFLAAAADRVHYLFKQMGNPYILPANTFPPSTILGSMAVTGSGAGTYTDSAVVDTTKYGGAQIELEVTGGTIGAASIVATVHVTLANGSTTTRQGTITNGSAEGTKVALGASTDRIVDVTSVTFTGGTEGDAFRVQTIEDRTL